MASSELVVIGPDPSRSTESAQRIRSMVEELRHAWERTPNTLLGKWSTEVAGDFASSLGRRVSNVAGLVITLMEFNGQEIAKAYQASRQERFSEHLRDRAGAAVAWLKDFSSRSKQSSQELIEALRSEPSKVGPHLLTMVITSIVVAGGPDGDGGVPDMDLLGGIGAHRSPWTHSILMGATLETGFLALIRLVQLVHSNLPPRHDPKWDELAVHASSILHAANKGTSIGLSYHFLVDGLVQPGSYHGLPIELPAEAHSALQSVNGVAEALDVRHKRWLLSTPQWLRESIHRWPWVQEGWPTPRTTSEEDHRAALQTPFEVDSETADFLSADELALVRRHGTWMEGLTSGKLGATTSTQERFVKAAWGLVDPKTPHERAWTMYLAGKYWVPK